MLPLKVNILIPVILTLLMSCKNEGLEEAPNADDKILVKLENKALYLSDIQALIPQNSNAQDSNQIIRAFSENWAKEAVVLLGAEESVPKDFNLERLVRNYRESLLINNFEKTYLEANLDTAVTEAQLESFYEENSLNIITNEPLLKFWFAKIPAKKKGLDKFFERWKKKDLEYVTQYCEENASVFDLLDSEWQAVSQAKQFFPEALQNKIAFDKKKNHQYNHNDYEYFLSIKNVIKAGEPEPMSYIEDKLIKLILHQRKSEMLDGLRNSLYQQALEKNKIVFYNNN